MATTTPADASFWDDISQLLGKSAAGAGGGRAQEGFYRNQRDTIAARLYDIAQTARTQAASQNLAGDKFRAGLPGQGASEAVRGAIIQNAQPVTMTEGTAGGGRSFHFAGGESLENFTPETRAAGAALAHHGSQLLNDPASFYTKTPGSGIGGADFLTAPAQSAEPTAGFWENAAGAGSVTTGLLGALAKMAGGGNSGAANMLKKLLSGGGGGSSPGGIDNSGNTEDTRTEYNPETPTGEFPGPTDWWNQIPGGDNAQAQPDEGVPIGEWNPDDSGY